MNAPMMTILTELLPALAGRPVPAAGDPFAGLEGLLGVAERLSDLKAGGSGGGDDDPVVGIIKSIVPVVKPALEAIPSLMAQRPPPQPRLPPRMPPRPRPHRLPRHRPRLRPRRRSCSPWPIFPAETMKCSRS